MKRDNFVLVYRPNNWLLDPEHNKEKYLGFPTLKDAQEVANNAPRGTQWKICELVSIISSDINGNFITDY